MSAYSCAQLRDVAPELALGVLGGAERAEAIMHVNDCARCQALVNELSEAADALPLLAPEIEPPFGFEQRVLSSGRARRRRSVRRMVAAVAVAAAAAAILSITVVRVVESGSDATSVEPRRGRRRREADRGEDGQRERPPGRMGLRHEQALGRDRAELRRADRQLPNRGAAAYRIDGDHRHDGDRRTITVPGPARAAVALRAGSTILARRRRRRAVLPRNNRLSPDRLRADETRSCRVRGVRNANVPGVGPCRACCGQPRADGAGSERDRARGEQSRSSARRSTGLSSDIGDKTPPKGGTRPSWRPPLRKAAKSAPSNVKSALLTMADYFDAVSGVKSNPEKVCRVPGEERCQVRQGGRDVHDLLRARTAPASADAGARHRSGSRRRGCA